MRIRAGECEPRTLVYVNDVAVSDVLEADDSEGWVKKAVRDERGNLVPDGDQLKIEMLRGRVRISVGPAPRESIRVE